MLRRNRSKIGLAVVFLACGAIMAFGYDGPESDREFVMQLVIVFEVVLFVILVGARVVRCPDCGDDMGYFHGWGPFRHLRRPLPRRRTCRRCGQTVDLWKI